MKTKTQKKRRYNTVARQGRAARQTAHHGLDQPDRLEDGHASYFQQCGGGRRIIRKSLESN